jgi:2-polyprenyl-3-methyl-5-hydroxy-6-metoxy-1,4-benzoquinol methylase
MKNNCPVCEGQSHIYYGRMYDDRYGYPGGFDLLQCTKCSHRFLLNSFSPLDISNQYSNYYPRKSFSIDAFKPLKRVEGFAGWLAGDYRAYSVVPPNVTVLDIGCGFCESLAYHASRGCDVYGVEADENSRKVADKFGFKLHIGQFSPHLFSSVSFDYITMDQVIEHMKDPIEILRGAAQILKPGGKVAITTPNSKGFGAAFFGRKWINWHVPYHLQHYSRASLRMAATAAGLKLKKMRTLTSSDWLYYQWIHSITYPPAGEPSDFWSPASKGIKGNLALKMRCIEFMRRLKVNMIFTRILDLLGIGDNWLIILEKPLSQESKHKQFPSSKIPTDF